jgi:hypothetical protein
VTRDAIMAELLEIEGLLQDDRLNDSDGYALFGAQRALRNVLNAEKWQQASQTFYRIDNKPSEAVSRCCIDEMAAGSPTGTRTLELPGSAGGANGDIVKAIFRLPAGLH